MALPAPATSRGSAPSGVTTQSWVREAPTAAVTHASHRPSGDQLTLSTRSRRLVSAVRLPPGPRTHTRGSPERSETKATRTPSGAGEPDQLP